MREALSALTTRGRAFLAAGLTATVSAVLIGQQDLLRIGVLVTVLPLVTAYVVGRSRYRLALVRSVNPEQVSAGQQAGVSLELGNEGRTRTGVLQLEDQLPYVLGTRPRFLVDAMRAGETRTVSYTVRADVRGKYPLGPMTVRVGDPFGMVEMNRSFRSASYLTVTPRVVPLAKIATSGSLTGSGDDRPRSFASGQAEDVTVREYVQGDDLRRVHWRSSARTGELMVRREEQPWQSRATIFLDTRASSHRGTGAASSLETAVSMAASVGTHLTAHGHAVRLVTAAGEQHDSTWHDRSGTNGPGPLLEALAVLEPSGAPRLDTRWLSESTQGGLLVSIFGAVSDDDRSMVARLRHFTGQSLAIVLDVDAWQHRSGGGSDAGPPFTGWLNAHGWRAVTLGPRDRLDAVWSDLGRAGAPSGRGRAS